MLGGPFVAKGCSKDVPMPNPTNIDNLGVGCLWWYSTRYTRTSYPHSHTRRTANPDIYTNSGRYVGDGYRGYDLRPFNG